MSKKIISKIKKPHHKCSTRSSSVGNDSCLRDEEVEYPSLCRCARLEEPQESIEHQLRRLELINDNLTKHLHLIDNNKHDLDLKYRQKYNQYSRNSYSMQQPLVINDDSTGLSKVKHYCDLVDSSFEDFRRNNSRHKSEYVKQIDDHNHKPRHNKYWDQEKCDNQDAKLMPVTPSGPESKLCSSMTYFGAPFQTKNNPTNDRVSNSSDTSRQSYSSSQHLRIGIDLFNRNLRFGVEYMQAKGLVDSDEDLADMFIKRKGFSKMRLFEFLTAKENRSVHKCFCNRLDLKFKTIPELLREYLKFSFITGEYGTMLEIVDVLGHAYIDQHSEGAVMGLNVSQVITIIQYLIAFNANEQKEKSSNRISRESFIEYLQTSLTEENKISRQLASCLYWEMCEAPLATTMDERFQNLDKIRKMLTDLPKDFNLIQYHRYIICHVDLNKVVLPVNGSEKPTFHERTVFLFNDSLVITKKNWLYDSSSYRVKQIINLNQINCALVTRSASFTNPSVSPMRIVQIVNSSNTDTLLNFHSKVFEDLMSFYTSLENAIGIHRAVIEVYLEYEARSRS